MTASINFLAGFDNVTPLNGSGLAFFNGSFGASLPVGGYNLTTWISDATTPTMGSQSSNLQYLNSASGIVNSATSGIPLTCIPQNVSTLHIQFQNSTAVKTQNAKWRFYDRVSISNDPSGVTAYAAQLIHPNIVQDNSGSGNSTWQQPTGSSVIMSLTSSPGLSGQFVNGVNTSGTIHDFYLAISVSPNSIGAKTFAGYFSLEYL